ncbi:MAG: hypothetical protein COV45_01470 [Deltaproteobacteria bacterium CG11_big_fil_rev_8_21_14_0_20_47_16]|nr:MAG: hypothetical protein COV45_01470 [Deltaproteobacteria bacterium CG11_big_fil_rev_8_21_14_0_20_47_16]
MTTKSTRVIKRYPNRKLYDTLESCYVTLDDIGQMIKTGEDIQVIDNNTHEDLTSMTLAQIIFEEEKKRKSPALLTTLRGIIQSSGETLRDFVQKSVENSVREFSHVRDDVTDFVDRISARGQLSANDRHNLLSIIRNFVEVKIKPTVKNVQNIPTVKSEIKQLQSKLTHIEKHLKGFKQKRSKTHKKK